MSYSVDELYSFKEINGEGTLMEYLRKDDPTITELEIPVEYHGFPVTRLWDCFEQAEYLERVVIPSSIRVVDATTFFGCKSLEIAELSEGLEEIGVLAFRGTNLKSIVLPKSLKKLGAMAFAYCHSLESITFNSAPTLGAKVFADCHKLPADITLMGLVNSRDISKPFIENAFMDAFGKTPASPGGNEYLQYTRPDVFELALKNNCFRSVDVFVMLKYLFCEGHEERLRFVAEHGLPDNRELADKCIERSAQEGLTELTAYLLELKNKKFGFNNGGDRFEL